MLTLVTMSQELWWSSWLMCKRLFLWKQAWTLPEHYVALCFHADHGRTCVEGADHCHLGCARHQVSRIVVLDLLQNFQESIIAWVVGSVSKLWYHIVVFVDEFPHGCVVFHHVLVELVLADYYPLLRVNLFELINFQSNILDLLISSSDNIICFFQLLLVACCFSGSPLFQLLYIYLHGADLGLYLCYFKCWHTRIFVVFGVNTIIIVMSLHLHCSKRAWQIREL